ncbi:hypothetical protein HDU87_002684 [Geranomyces variabilis]|uniref:UNC-45/Cro1/She4 central domain-containing protein n=1 Tax=Geranomyces variabilis TaxID=109894 RepID=A0AAD5XQX2_9FUNG|nr:hypothetical protein HDU87_002684 [Geranomyces variabilis]
MTQPHPPPTTATAASTKARLLAESAAHAAAKRYDLALASLKAALALDKADPETLAALRTLVEQATRHASTDAAAQTPRALLLAATGGVEGGVREREGEGAANMAAADASRKLAILSAGDPAVSTKLLADGAVERLLPALLGPADPGDRAALGRILGNILASHPPAAISVLPFFTAESLNTSLKAVSDSEPLTRQFLDLISTVVHRSAQDPAASKPPLLTTNAFAVLNILVSRLAPDHPTTVRAAAFGCLIRAVASEPLALALVTNGAATTALIALVADPDDAVRNLVPSAFVRIFEQVQKTPANRAAVQAALGAHIAECVAASSSSSPQQEGKTRARGLLALAAVFQADGACAAALFDAKMLELVLRGVERDEHDDASAARETRLAFLELLSAACGEKQSRTLIAARCGPFLARIAKNSKGDTQQATAAAVALTKLQAADAVFVKTSSGMKIADPIAMADVFIATLLAPNTTSTTQSSSSTSDTLRAAATEGLAYLSLRPRVKAHITAHPTFLKRVLAAAAAHKPITFGLATVLANCTDFRRKLTQEERNVRDLRRMAKADDGSATTSSSTKNSTADDDDEDDENDPLDDDDAVAARGVVIVQCGAVPVLLAKGKEPATARVRAAVARTLCSLACTKSLHSTLIQQGAVRGLLELTRSRQQQQDEDDTTTTRIAAHALAKIAITADPNIAFRADLATELVRPLLDLLRDDNNQKLSTTNNTNMAPSSLVRFEALLALTNLASFPPARARIAHAHGVPLFEAYLFADHPLLRRAATEAICNMVFEDAVFEAYASGGKASKTLGGGAAAFRMLLALADAEDFPTRRAASGAVAVLTVAPGVCARVAGEGFDNAVVGGGRAAGQGGDDEEGGGDDGDKKGGDTTRSAERVPRGIEIVLGLLDSPVAAAGSASAATAAREAGELQHRGVECVKNMCHAGKEIAAVMVAAGARQAVERFAGNAGARGQLPVPQVVREGAVDALAAIRQWGL